MKHCSRCNQDLREDMFSKNKSCRDGLAAYCKTCQRAAHKLWKMNNRELAKSSNAASNRRCSHRRLAANRQWMKKKGCAYNAAKSAAYRARARSATPSWLSAAEKEEIKSTYRLAEFFTWISGGFVEYHVDHAVPLGGKDVCGLHVPWNLQVLRSDENQAKYNKHI